MSPLELPEASKVPVRKRKKRSLKSLRNEIRHWFKHIENRKFLWTVLHMVRREAMHYENLPDHVKKGICEGLRDIAAGHTFSHEEVEKELFG